MKKIIKMPKIILTHGLTAVLLFIASLFISDNLDISTHDAYYTMSKSLLIVVLAILFGVFAATAWGFEKIHRPLSPSLNWLHYGITITCILIIAFVSMSSTSQKSTFENYSALDQIGENQSQMSMNEWLAITVSILLLCQLLFIINVIRAFVIQKKSG
jgi:heme/copper-type cytochrome/quinol oxidase subunit 1